MSTLQTQPIRRYRRAAYPTALEVKARPLLLRRYMPPGWLSQADITAVAGAFLATNLSGCSSKPPFQSATSQPTTQPNVPAVVAPIFSYNKEQREIIFERELSQRTVLMGDTIGPSFLSEQEAIGIILDELAQHGIKPDRGDVDVPSILIEGTEIWNWYDWISEREGQTFFNATAPLNLDLWDSTRCIGIEYISKDDFPRFTATFPTETWNRNLDWNTNPQKVATNLAAEVQRQGKNMYFGVFFDSGDDSHYLGGDKTILRQQVKDFVDWLKGQGVI